MNLLWLDLRFRRRVRAEVKRLGPWYHQIQILPFLWTRPWTQATIGELIHAERGGPKFRRFILPLIKPYLNGATVVELGTNAGQMLVCCLRAGAAETWGIEPDHRYRSQAMLVRQCLSLQRRMTIIDHIPQNGQLSYRRRANLGLICAVLRHIPEGERVLTLERMGSLCVRMLIQGSGLKDAPEGDSITSILRYIRETNLRVEEVRSEPHVRGLRILVRAK